MRTVAPGLIVLSLAGLYSPDCAASDFEVRFENHTNRAIRIKTIKFGNQGAIALNNGRGFELAPEGTNGDVQSASFSGDDSRVIAVWDRGSGDFLGFRQERLNQKAFVGVTPLFGDPTRVNIAIGALP